MFGQLGQLANLMRNAGKISQSMKDMNDRLADARFAGDAGAGQVTATVDGRGDLVGMKIDPELVKAGDVELIEDLIVAATRAALNRSREAMQQEMSALTGGLDLGDMSKLLGGA